MRSRRRGITLLQLLVAVFILLLVVGIVSVILLQHVQRGKSAAVVKDITSIKTAINSAVAREDMKDENGDGNYLDDLVRKRYLSKEPRAIQGANYTVEAHFDNETATVVYFLRIDCASTEECVKIFKDLDKEIDNSDGPDAGYIQWTES